MKFIGVVSLLTTFLVAETLASKNSAATFDTKAFDHVIRKRQSTASQGNGSSPIVDLGYSVYQGYTNTTSGLNVFKGVRYAQAPVGPLRWQAPQAPLVNRSQTIMATSFPPSCPQAPRDTGASRDAVAATVTASAAAVSEDCLFLDIYAPSNATNLPVLVWIHGGGYGQGNGQGAIDNLVTANDNGFIGVTLQYRLGAFGFLSSDEVARNGVANAGLRDMTFALQWVQSYIHLFGGNASAVTISGESAGGGAVMLQTMAFGGQLGSTLFQNSIASSPYLPMQYNYNDWVPSQSYYAFAGQAGCLTYPTAQNSQVPIFQCLQNASTAVLQNASAVISASANYGEWGFLPVTDGTYITQLPSKQLLKKQVNGVRMLTGNNANEGPLFVPQNITTESSLLSWISSTFPLLTPASIAKILLYYPSPSTPDPMNPNNYATLGYTGATAINESSIASGQQQRANNIYAESTFVCPSYWLSEAYTDLGRSAYKYQFSVLPAVHGIDVSAFFNTPVPGQGAAFIAQFQRIWGNFVRYNDPSLMMGAAGNGSVTGAVNWPAFNLSNPVIVNLNQTGGTLVNAGIPNLLVSYGQSFNTSYYVGPGLAPNFTQSNAYTWEGGRGFRCDFWRSEGGIVPE